jgi:putative ABC transport system permease protein
MMRHDFLYAVRALYKRPLFACAAVLTLALGIGANSAIFSVVHAVLLRPLPYPAPDRLMTLWSSNPRQGFDKDVSAYPNFDDWRRQSRSFDGMSAYFGADFALTAAGDPVQITGALVTPGFFETLGVAPARGRAFSPREGEAGASRVAVLSHALWQARFGSDPAIVGRTIVLNGVSYEVVGVMPATFAFPETAQLWTPLAPWGRYADFMQSRGSMWLRAIGRLKPGVARGTAQAELDTIAAALERQYPDVNAGIGIRLVPMHEEIVGEVRQPLLVLLAAVGFVLLIACANVANLLLTRAAARQKELAIRAALGAGRRRLITQMLIESLVLAGAGAAVGLLLAAWGVQALAWLAPADLPRAAEIRIDGAVMLYALLAALVTGLIFGTAPALQSSVVSAGEGLKQGGRSGSAPSRSRRLRAAVAVVEIAIALVLLIGAGLLVRSFVAMNNVDLGFDPRHTLALRIDLPAARYPEGSQVSAFYSDLLSRLHALPGVESVGLGSSVLLSALPQSADLTVQGRPRHDSNATNAPVPYDSVTPGFFEALRIPLRRGRLFTDADGPTAQPVAVVNESLARRFFPAGDALGARIAFGDAADPQTRWATIIGIVGDTRRGGLNRPAWAEVYYPHAQVPDPRVYALVRTSGDPLMVARAAQAAVWAVDPNQPVHSIHTVEGLLAASQANRRFTTIVLGVFSIVALALAAIGVYGVIAYSTAQRTQEIGIRLALGATRGDVLTMVLKEGAAIGLVGLAIGMPAAFVLTRSISSLLFNVGARDPMSFVVLPAGLMLVIAAATLIPAARALRVDPVLALRAD